MECVREEGRSERAYRKLGGAHLPLKLSKVVDENHSKQHFASRREKKLAGERPPQLSFEQRLESRKVEIVANVEHRNSN